jgi:hypothetical protein
LNIEKWGVGLCTPIPLSELRNRMSLVGFGWTRLDPVGAWTLGASCRAPRHASTLQPFNPSTFSVFTFIASIIARFWKQWEYRIGGIGAIKENFTSLRRNLKR